MRGLIIDKYPDEVRQKIEFLIDSNFNGKAIHEWLQDNYFPKWKQIGRKDLIVTERTVRNWLRNYCPQKRLLSQSYIDRAVDRLEKDKEVLQNIEGDIAKLKQLINSFGDIDKLSLKSKAELRRQLKESIEANKKHLDILMRLGVVKEEPKKSTQFIFSKTLKEISEKHEEKPKKSKEEEIVERALKQDE